MSQIYLISPPEIVIDDFLPKLEIALKTNRVPVFQLRLKNYPDNKMIEIGKKILEICQKNNVLFILNDRLDLALEIGAGGVHLGGEDQNIKNARTQTPDNFIIGASCYDSKHLAVEAVENGANYISFGTFFPSKTKNSHGKPTPEILEWCDEILNISSVAIGGITDNNCQELVKYKADFLAVVSYIWDHPDGIEIAINNLFKKIS